jgi:hypothetical protein
LEKKLLKLNLFQVLKLKKFSKNFQKITN